MWNSKTWREEKKNRNHTGVSYSAQFGLIFNTNFSTQLPHSYNAQVHVLVAYSQNWVPNKKLT